MGLREQVNNADRLAEASLSRDLDIFLDVLRGKPVPAECNLNELLDRIDYAERRKLQKAIRRDGPQWWWTWPLADNIWNTFQRRLSLCSTQGDHRGALREVCRFGVAMLCLLRLVLRYGLFPVWPPRFFGLRPLNTIAHYLAT